MYDPMEDPQLIDIENYKGRLSEFLKMEKVSNFDSQKILVPGSALGGECFAALELGAAEVTGIEISKELVVKSQEYAQSRAKSNVFFYEFDGKVFPNSRYDLILSGHVIEHSSDWREHLRECIRVSRPNGRIYLEFPSRFYFKELHTGLISFEWMPSKLRSAANNSTAKIYKLLGMHTKSIKRQSIQDTLQQVSHSQIKNFLSVNYGDTIMIRASSSPAPGIKRLIIS